MWQIGYQCLIDALVEWIRCYSDNEIEYVDPNWNYGCDSWLEISDRTEWSLRLHPNPGTDHFTLQLPPGEHDLKIFDQLGRAAIEMDRISDQAEIGTTSLPPSIYTVRITDRNGRSLQQRWIKE